MLWPSRRFIAAVFALVLLAGGGAYYWHRHSVSVAPVAYKTPEEADAYVRFDMEAYDKIGENYWNSIPDDQLANLFQLSLEKAAGTTTGITAKDRATTAQMIARAMNTATSTDAKKQLALNTVIVALYNLAPAGRDSLLSAEQETSLRQSVSNVNLSKDLYQDLGIQKGASSAVVETAYQQKVAALKNATSSEALAERDAASYAHRVLANKSTKGLYDQTGIEPTGFSHVIGHTLYFDMTKISPTTLQEFAWAIDAASTTPNLDSMILDVRGNVGGAFDFMQAFLGLFIGQGQYAFDLYRHGEYDPQRTTQPKFEELKRYRDIAILTDNMTQSTAEVMTAAFKRYNLAHVVGGTTRGWGTVENTYPMDTIIDPNQKYSLLLVNNVTLRDDNQPIEGRGVDPDINISAPDWKQQLTSVFTSASLIAALKQQAAAAPLH